MESILSFLPLILLLVLFYFFFIRPQNKQQKELQEMRNNIKIGDEIITIGGFYGVVYAVDEKNVVLEMLPDFNRLMITKAAISRVITEEESVIDNEEDTGNDDADITDESEAIEAPTESVEETEVKEETKEE